MSRVIFIGDSHVAGWMHLRRGLLPLLWGFTPPPIISGVGGHTVADLHARIRSGLLASAPRLVMVQIGANQLAREIPVARTVEEIRNVVQEIRVRVPDVRIVLSGIIPSDPWEWPVVPKVLEINAELAETPGVTFSDPAPALLSEGKLRVECYSADRIHLTMRGYSAWGRVLTSALQRAAEPTS
jgi:lysophospholipase L1-like esterase